MTDLTEYRLFRRAHITRKVEVVQDAKVLSFDINNTAVVEFDDEPGRRRWYSVGDGTGTVDTGRFYDFWVGKVSS